MKIQRDLNLHCSFVITNFSFSIGQHSLKPRSLHSSFHKLLMFETHACVVAVADVSEVVDEGLHYGVILPVDGLRLFLAEFALLVLGVLPALGIFGRH